MLPKSLFRALAHRNFRLYFFGQGISVLGTWMQQVAVAWVVYSSSGSPLWLGLVSFAGQIPVLFLAPFTGAFIDRARRQRVVLFTQASAMSLAFVLASLTLSGHVTVWHLFFLSLLSGVVDAFDIPARQLLMTDMVGPGDDLANAIALNSSIYNGARLMGPALAGVLLASTSPGVCFLANGASYLAVLVALLAMRLPLQRRFSRQSRFLAGVGEGLAYAWNFSPIRALLLLAGLVSMAAAAVSTLLPIVATTMPHGDATTLGLLTAAIGAGALAGTILLAARKSIVGLGKWIAAAPALFGLGLLAFTQTSSLMVSILLLAVVGFALLLLMAATNTVLQMLVEDDKRGLVMSLFTMVVTGLAPVGGLLAGLLAHWAGTTAPLCAAGIACLIGSLGFISQYGRLRAEARPIYVRKGLVEESVVQVSGTFPSPVRNALVAVREAEVVGQP
jgi:MFS family permease